MRVSWSRTAILSAASALALSCAATLAPATGAAPGPGGSSPAAAECAAGGTPLARRPQRPRIVIMNDGEVDDMDSFIRYLYYANEFDTEAIVLTSSMYHWAGDGKKIRPYRWTGETWLPEYLGLYAKIYPKLAAHARGYPTPAQLSQRYVIGNIASVSDTSAPTGGSRAIERIILDDDDRPVYFQAWGGLNTLARALKSIEEKYQGTRGWTQIQRKVSAKVVVYNILNQDDTLKKYIQPSWPRIKVLDNQDQFWSFAYMWPDRVNPADQYVLKAPWMRENLLRGTGPLMGEYRTYRDGKPTPGDDENNRWRPEVSERNQNTGYQVNDFISEGDSPAFLYLIGNGLRSAENPAWGGWGGRFAATGTGWIDTGDRNPVTGAYDRSYSLTRWFPDLQADFAGRVRWGLTACFGDANHPPHVQVSGGTDRTVRPGERITLRARAADPDGDSVSYRWWQYADADSYPGRVTLSSARRSAVQVQIPASARPGQSIHLIVEARDGGTPALKHYQRVILTIG